MHIAQVLALLLVGACSQAAVLNASAPLVDLGYARFKGVHNETLGLNTFYGIKFAAPPVGQLRWRSAVPIERQNNYTHNQVVDATVPGAQCMQSSSGGGLIFFEILAQVPGVASAESAALVPRNSSEDCLLLDVIAPSKPKSSALPVIIQIHGGGYNTGNSQTSDGTVFTKYANGSVVWVQIQYRLGAYGFLGAQEVLDDGDPNLGITDQKVAFEWVQRHIHKFGGDPKKVTIWGSSAGGGSVMNHLIINPTDPNPPFRAAIAEFPWFQPYHDTPILEAQYRQLLNASGCHDLACLRQLSQADLAKATSQSELDAVAQGILKTGDDYYGPYIDGKLVKDLPSNEFKKGNFIKVPLLTDHDGEEGVIFQDFTINTTSAATADLQRLFPTAKSSFFTRLYEVYNLSDFTGDYFKQPFFSSIIYSIISRMIPTLSLAADNSPYWRLQQLFGDFVINCPTYYMGTALSDAGVKVWKLICSAGIYVHGATGIYVLAPNEASNNATTSVWMKEWFLNFVVDLDPNSKPSSTASNGTVRPFWPTYQSANSSQFTIMQVNDTNLGAQGDTDASDRCDFFHSESYVVRN